MTDPPEAAVRAAADAISSALWNDDADTWIASDEQLARVALKAALSHLDGAASERGRIRQLADKWSDEAARYARYGQPGDGYERNGDSPSHRSCRQIARTLAEVAGELRAWLEVATGPGSYERLFFPQGSAEDCDE